MAFMNNNILCILMNICTYHDYVWVSMTVHGHAVCVVTAVLHRSAAASTPSFCSKMLLCFFLFFFFLLQFWKSSHRCCIDTPVEGPGEESSESSEPAAWPHYLSLRAPHPPDHPPLRLLSPRTTLHLPLKKCSLKSHEPDFWCMSVILQLT